MRILLKAMHACPNRIKGELSYLLYVVVMNRQGSIKGEIERAATSTRTEVEEWKVLEPREGSVSSSER